MNVWFGAEEYAQTQYAISSQKPLISLYNSTVIAIDLDVSVGAVRLDHRLRRIALPHSVRSAHVSASDAAHDSADRRSWRRCRSITRRIGLIDTRIGLILVYFLTTLPYAVWMTKSFIDEVPREIEQAAEILGASRWRTVFEIVLPLIRSGLVATFLFILILTWSEYLLALIITKTQVTTLPIELSKYQGSTEGRVYGRQAALAVGITVPLMIVGLIIRKHLARGFSFGMVRR